MSRFLYLTEVNCWNDKDRQAAQAEGWDVFDIDSTGILEIQRVDESDKFKSDHDAAKHVRDQANRGSSLHLRAILTIAAGLITDIARLSVEDTEPSDLADLITKASDDRQNMADITITNPCWEGILRTVYHPGPTRVKP